MPTKDPATITDIKSTFLRTQIRLLSTLFTLPTNINNELSESTTPALPAKTTEDLLSKLNAKLKSHNRLVFSAPSQRHVAEQIDSLYWNEVTSTSISTHADETSIFLNSDVDLCDSGVVRSLPETLDEFRGRDEGERGEEEERYTAALSRAKELTARRDQLRETVRAYRALRGLLTPFRDVKVDVQPNLVTKDGELAKEMERMRVLVARVEGGLGKVRQGEMMNEDESAGGVKEVGVSDKQKLARVMELG